MVEINEAEREKGKRMKGNKNNFRDTQQTMKWVPLGMAASSGFSLGRL